MNKGILVGVCAGIVLCGVVGWFLVQGEHLHMMQTPSVVQTPQTFTMTFPLTKVINAHADHAHTPDGPRSDWMYHSVVLKEDMAVTGIRAVIENAPPEIIHHLSLVSLGLPDAVCGNSTHAGQREYFTISRTNVYDDVAFPAPYAIMMKAGEELSLEVMTHVLEKPFGPGGTYPDAVVKIELTYEAVDKERTEPVMFVRLRLDDTECTEPLMHQAFVVPKGEGVYTATASTTSNLFSENSDEYTFAVPGVILDRSANVWGTKGGQTLDVLMNEAVIETYTAVPGNEPWQWTIPLRRDPLTVAAGDTLAIQATYKQSSSTAITDASGIFGFYFAPKLTKK